MHDQELPPRVFRAFIGGFMGESYEVDLKDDALVYRVSPGSYDGWLEKELPIAAIDWREFRASLDAVNVWLWRDSYRAFALDGTHWSLEIEWGGQVVSSAGENCFPDSAGEAFDGFDPPSSFTRYLRAVERLLGGRKFR